VGHQPGGEAVDHAQQPFEGEHPPGAPTGSACSSLMTSTPRGRWFDLDREVVEHHAQAAGDAFQRGLKSRR
jgi:hypothetical protein